jgi:hypothetical protein
MLKNFFGNMAKKSNTNIKDYRYFTRGIYTKPDSYDLTVIFFVEFY